MNDKCKCGAKLKYNVVEETENFERYETLDCIKYLFCVQLIYQLKGV